MIYIIDIQRIIFNSNVKVIIYMKTLDKYGLPYQISVILSEKSIKNWTCLYSLYPFLVVGD